MQGKWIWLSDGKETENERGCFAARFRMLSEAKDCRVRITAVTRYALYLNGAFVGRGPVRSARGTYFFDEYDITPLLCEGENYLAVQVWNYGWSTYQSLWDEGGLLFEVTADGQLLAASSEEVLCLRDAGHLPFSPKRNVNLGFTDYYDARSMAQNWLSDPNQTDSWTGARLCQKQDRALRPRPIRPFFTRRQYAQRVLRVEDVAKNVQTLTVNTRETFFPSRRDADETNFNGFIGCEIESDSAMSGRISFPNRTWNGILGTFRIGKTVYPVTDRQRDVAAEIPAGRSLFLLQVHGKFDDLYCHLEFRFPYEVRFAWMGTDRCFFTIGPTALITNELNGAGVIHDDIDFLTDTDRIFFACTSLDELTAAGAQLRYVARRYVMQDAYLLSLARLAEVKKTWAVQPKHLGLLWNNDACTLISLPQCGDYRRILVDFGDEYVGTLDFTVQAPAGTILEFYGFENSYRGEIDYTIGLNNGVRYICREGWQRYRCMTRMGFRYLMISVRHAAGPVRIRDLHLDYAAFPCSNTGSFECNDEALNHIWLMCRHTHELCLEDSFTDSPAYEQAFWLGDAQTSAAVNAFVFGDYTFTRHNLLLATTAVQNTPLFNALTPTDWGTSIPMWTMNWVVSLVQYIEASGDRSVLPELYPSLRGMLLHYRSLLNEEGGFSVSAWNLIDWAPIDAPSSGVVTSYQGLLACCFERCAGFADSLGHGEDGALYRGTAEIMLRYLDEKLWDESRGAFYDGWSREKGFSKTFSVQTHTLLLLYDVIRDPRKRELTRGYTLQKPADFVDVGSPFMLYYLYEAWAMVGRQREIFEDVKKRWGEMFRYETTTCWEVFPGFYENSRTRSYCHSWSTAPAALMQKYLLGIRRDSEGFRDVSYDFPDTPLRWCRGAVPTPFGPIYVDWNKDLGEFLLCLPEKITLHGEPPAGFRMTVQRTANE